MKAGFGRDDGNIIIIKAVWSFESDGCAVRYVRPQTAVDAARLLEDETGVARILAGGTDVLVQLKAGTVEPDLIVDIKGIAGLRSVTPEADGFRVGAAVSGAELGEHAGVAALWPGVVEAFQLIGSTQVQGRATMAGNLCNGSPAADSVPALIAANAVARIAGPGGERDCPVEEIPVSPGRISLAKGEFITSFYLPARPPRSGDAISDSSAHRDDIAVASCG